MRTAESIATDLREKYNSALLDGFHPIGVALSPEDYEALELDLRMREPGVHLLPVMTWRGLYCTRGPMTGILVGKP